MNHRWAGDTGAVPVNMHGPSASEDQNPVRAQDGYRSARALHEGADLIWSAPSAHPRLRDHEVHVWRGGLDIDERELLRRTRMLNELELARADRFVRAGDRARFIAARGFLREVVGRYLGLAAATVNFEYGANGKPHLAGEARGLGFNLSHSGDWALCALARTSWVGVDAERIRVDLDVNELTGILTPSERTMLDGLKGPDRADAFFRLWTRKEALVKALGAGLSEPLERLDVGLEAKDDSRETHERGYAGRTWWLASAAPAPDYAGAVAVEGSGWKLSRWHANSSPRHSPGADR